MGTNKMENRSMKKKPFQTTQQAKKHNQNLKFFWLRFVSPLDQCRLLWDFLQIKIPYPVSAMINHRP